MSEHFDVCVLGGQPAGFLAAALLAKRGKRVVLIDHGEGFDHYKQGGVSYPLLVQPLVGLRGFKLADTVLKELGAQVDLPRRYIEANPPLQVIFPRHRLDLGNGNVEIAKEAKREFGESALPQALDALSADANLLGQVLEAEPVLPMPGVVQRFSQTQRLKARSALALPSSKSPVFSYVSPDDPTGEMLLGASLFSTYLDDDDPPEAVLAFLAERTLSGSVRLESGGGTYLDALTQLVSNAGGVVKRGAMIDKLESDGKRLVGAETAGSARFQFNADYFVTALYSHALWQSLPRSRALTHFIEENGELRVRAKLYFHHFLVREEGLPVGLGDNVLLLNGRKRGRDDGTADTAVWVTVRRNHSKDHALMSAAIEVREGDASSLPEHLAMQRKRVRKQLERFLPFISSFIVAESSPMSPSEWDAQDGTGRRLDPWLLHPLYEPMPEALLGVTGLPFHTPFKNLFRVGRETLPGLGPLGDFVGARMAAKAVQLAAGDKSA